MPRENQIPVACFAPALTDEKLARYKALIEDRSPDSETRDALETLLRCVEAWWAIPESSRSDGPRYTIRRVDAATGQPNGSYIAQVTPLEPAQVEELWETTPWMRELDTLSNAAATGLLDSLPAGELRDAAFHLLWHAKEITLDREPMTVDRLSA